MFLNSLPELLDQVPPGSDREAELVYEIAGMEAALDSALDSRNRLLDGVQRGIPVTHDITERIRMLDRDIADGRKELNQLQLELSNTSDKLIQSRVNAAIKIHESQPLDRLQLNTALKALIKHMVLDDDTLDITELLLYPFGVP